MPTRVCLGCGQLTSKPSQRGYCSECQASWEQARPARAVYDTTAWRRLSSRAVTAWVKANGWVCPGWHRNPHPSHDLTLDHSTALAAGGPAYPTDAPILCRSCNGRKGAQPATATRTTA